MAKIMPPVRHCCRTYPNMNKSYVHCRCASDDRLIFYNITRCYGKPVTVFAVAIAAGDIIKYQSFLYGSFVWEIHVRYNKNLYQSCCVLFRKIVGHLGNWKYFWHLSVLSPYLLEKVISR